mgnify:FL=1
MVAVISVSLWRGSQLGAKDAQHMQDRADDPVQANAAVYKDQLKELEKEYVLGNLSSEELQVAREELARRLLDDVGDSAIRSHTETLVSQDDPRSEMLSSLQMAKPSLYAWRAPWVWVMSFVFIVPVAASVMYAMLGQPMALNPAALQADSEHGGAVSPEKMTEMATA